MYGIEKSYPQAVIGMINSKQSAVKASEVKIGALKITDKTKYDLIFDRISHHIPMYLSYLKFAALNGIKVINNPFWNCSDNNFMHTVFAQKNKLKTPKTVLLPSKEIPDGVAPDELHNLIYPLNWEEVFEYIGFPAFLKSNMGHSSYNAYKIYNPHEFFSAYDLTGKTTMILQESIAYEQYFRVFVIGKKNIRILSYDPVKPLHLRYENSETTVNQKLRREIEKTTLLITDFFDYEFNSIEFAVKDNIPYIVDFLNPAPRADKEYLWKEDFEWILENTVDLLLRKVNEEVKEKLITTVDSSKIAKIKSK